MNNQAQGHNKEALNEDQTNNSYLMAPVNLIRQWISAQAWTMFYRRLAVAHAAASSFHDTVLVQGKGNMIYN